jgi:hypothetical protein
MKNKIFDQLNIHAVYAIGQRRQKVFLLNKKASIVILMDEIKALGMTDTKATNKN